MSIKSTYYLDRYTALFIILEKICDATQEEIDYILFILGNKSLFKDRKTSEYYILKMLQECSNTDLEDILEEFKESEFRNYLVINYLIKGSIPSIQTLDEFNNLHVDLF